MRIVPLACLAFMLASCGQAADPQDPAEPTHIEVDDMILDVPGGGRAHATFHGATTDKPVASLLLLHQARSDARGEYGPIMEELSRAGFDLLLLDLRSGGDLFGENRTAANYDQDTTGYCDAIPDVDAAINWLSKREAPLFVVGSGYSAALAIRAADVAPDKVSGFIAFSPASGEPMAGCDPSEHFAAAGKGFVLRPSSEMGIDRVADQLSAFEDAGARTLVVENGVHGASMMVDERTGHDMATVRAAIIAFVTERATP